MSNNSAIHQPVGILGAGAAGLICAHVLLQDGFTDVTLISRDKSVGGTWARERVYPGLYINNVHGEYRFSALEMPLPEKASESGHILSGVDLCNYMENFSATFLEGKAKFSLKTEVLNVERSSKGDWQVEVKDLLSKETRTLTFSRMILATGGCSNPRVSEQISHEAAVKAGFQGLVMHSSSKFASRLDDILAAVKPSSAADGDDANADMVLVVGGGKSARDICAKLRNHDRKVVIVYERTDGFLASKLKFPDFVRKSRLLSTISPYRTLNTRLERFLHQTTIGSTVTHYLWDKLTNIAFWAYGIRKESPLRMIQPLFWGIRVSDEGSARPDSFFALANAGKIEVIAPARMVGYANSNEVLLSNDVVLTPKAVLLSTGYQSSWSSIFKADVAAEIGIERHAPATEVKACWDYKSLTNASPLAPENEEWVASIFRGLVPARNIEKRDFAIAGALFTANPGYTFEVSAHWIASYFRGDKMRIPSTAEEAVAKAEEDAAWMKTRFPSMLSWANESYSASLDFLNWPQAADDMLDDMYLRTGRSGGNWFNWAFKVIDNSELANLTEERAEKRRQRQSITCSD